MNLERELKRFVRQIRPGLIGATANPNVNLAQLVEELKNTPEHAEEVRRALRDYLVTRDYTAALTETGLTLEAGAVSEIYKRLEYKFLPKAVSELDILASLSRVFDAHSDANWLEKIDREKFGELLELILPERDKLIEPLAAQAFMSLEILSLRLGGLGYEPVVSHRLRSRSDLQHSFMNVVRHVHNLLEGKGADAIPEIREALDRCSQAVAYIRSKRGTEGISLALTYRLTKIQQVVRRMRMVVDLIDAMLVEWKGRPALDLFFEIMMAEIRRFDLRRFIGQNIELLAFQITEHTGRAGEHYITRTKSEWGWMLRSASLGGVIVAALVIMKTIVSYLHLPPIPEIIAYGSLYAGGFIFLHAMGATLATKQPAMTASTLAHSLDSATNSQEAIESLSEIIIRTFRSQIAALIGNYAIAFPAAAIICLPFNLMNYPLMSPEKAHHTFEALNGFHSLAFLYAAMAGVCLFVSGLLAGFADNWFIFNNVGLRLKQSPLLEKMVGRRNLDRAIHTIDHNLGFWVGNTALGFFLGSASAIGAITGLPIDIRHITFSSGQFGAAMASLKFNVPGSVVATIALSVFCFGLVNLAVSFSLTLFVTMKSRRIRFSQTPQLLKLLARKFLRRPLEFILPLRDPP